MSINKIDATTWKISTVCEYVCRGYHIKVVGERLFLVRVLG